MNGNIALLIVSFIYVLVLSIVYFSKRKYNFIESKMYKYLLIVTMVELVLEIVELLPLGLGQSLQTLVLKVQCISLFVWLILFAFYAILARSVNKYESFKELFKGHTSLYLWIITAVILFILLVVLQVWFNIFGIGKYDNSISLVYILGIVISTLVLVSLLFNNKEVAKYKNYSVLVSVMILLFVNFAQIIYIEFPIMSCGICLITLFQYFTMENPDLKYIDELNILKNKAEEANEAKTNFLASMSHEIRTPMNAIIGLSETLLNSNIPKEYRDDVKSINEAGNTLLEIVNNILDITKVEAGKTELKNAPYSLADTIAKLSHIVRVSLSERPIKFEVIINGNIPKELMGDEMKVYQVLMNILSNAVKYTKKGSIKFIVDSNIVGNKANLVFKISDTGIGIKKADNAKLFEKFERLDQEQSDIQGTGLGLVITKKLVDLMGGKISFESVYQQGTTFTVSLEQQIVDKTQVDMANYHAKKVTVGEYFDGSPYKILLVDDNLLNLKVAEKLLKKYNFQVTSVSTGLDCLNYTKHNKYDLIFLDHMMPEMDGIHTLYNMRNRAAGFDTPVVVLTANAIEGSKEMYLREGFVDYLSKPIDQVELDRILREQLKIDDNNMPMVDSNSIGVDYKGDESPATSPVAPVVVKAPAQSENVEKVNPISEPVQSPVVEEKKENVAPTVAPIFDTTTIDNSNLGVPKFVSGPPATDKKNENTGSGSTVAPIFGEDEINK